MYLDRVSGFANFLAERDHTLHEILNHMNRVVFMDLEPISIQLGQVNQVNLVVVTARIGDSADPFLQPQSVDLEDKTPETDAIRQGKVVFINTLPDWGADYPAAKNYPLNTHAKSTIAFPIYVSGTPVAAIVLMSRVILTLDFEMESFLKTIASVFSMYFYRNVLSSPDEIDELNPKNLSGHSDADANSLELTDRQLVILRLISEERTNLSISQFLGYSESTVRQEIMKIFAKLGCSHRNEAAVIYKSYSQKS